MTFDLRKLLDSKFLPHDSRVRMQRTLPGSLAHELGWLIYNLIEDKNEKSGERQYRMSATQILHTSDAHAELARFAEGKPLDKMRLLAEIQSYLEACALREILER